MFFEDYCCALRCPLQDHAGAAQRGAECRPHGGRPHVALCQADGLCHRLDGRGGRQSPVQVDCSLAPPAGRFDIAVLLRFY